MPADGCIEVGRFDEVQAEMKRMRAHFVGSAVDEEEKELAEKIWPYENRADDLFLHVALGTWLLIHGTASGLTAHGRGTGSI